MSRFRILAPNRGYSGEGYGMTFVKGEARTDNPRVAAMLRNRGYEVEGFDNEGDGCPPTHLSMADLASLNAANLRSCAAAHKVDLGNAVSEKEIIEKLIEAGAVAEKAEPEKPGFSPPAGEPAAPQDKPPKKKE